MCTFQEDGNERLAHRQLGRPLSLISVDPETHQITTKCFTGWRSGADNDCENGLGQTLIMQSGRI